MDNGAYQNPDKDRYPNTRVTATAAVTITQSYTEFAAKSVRPCMEEEEILQRHFYIPRQVSEQVPELSHHAVVVSIARARRRPGKNTRQLAEAANYNADKLAPQTGVSVGIAGIVRGGMKVERVNPLIRGSLMRLGPVGHIGRVPLLGRLALEDVRQCDDWRWVGS